MNYFSIHSVGDSAFLEQILIAVSAITGSGDFKQMVSIGLLLGVIIIAIQSLLQGAKEINFQQVLVGWILYACFFGPTTTVTIEDAYTGQVRPVANVPLGIGFAGGMISEIGYRLTRLFEQGYGVIGPQLTETRFAESLKLLNDVRWRTHMDSRVFKALNDANGGGYVNMRDSLENYMRDCTITKLYVRKMTLDELWNAPIDQALSSDSRIYGTLLYLDSANPQGTDYECADAWIKIRDSLSALQSPEVLDALNQTYGIHPALGDNAITKANDALQSVGAGSTLAQDYVATALLKPIYYQAAIGKYQQFHHYNSALMLNQAIQQRNTQQTAEQSMFMTVVRPLMTFFEGFVYAITPIMAFMIVMGGFGIKLAGKYMQTILWIQLWMPVLSIINLFIHMAASREMASLAASAAGLSSFYALDSAAQLAHGFSRKGGETFKHTWGDTLSQNLSKSASDLMSATKTFTTMSALQNQFGSMTNTDFRTLGGYIAQNPEALKSLNGAFQMAPHEVRQKARELEQRNLGLGMSPQIAEAGARLQAMTQTSLYPEGQKTRGLRDALGVLNLATGGEVTLGNPFENSGLRGPETEGVKDKVNESVGDGPQLAENFRGHAATMANTDPASEAAQLPSSSSLVQSEHQAGTAALQHRAAERERAVSAPGLRKAEDRLLHAQPEMSWSARGWGGYNNSTDWLARKAERGVGALVAGGQAGGKAFEGALEQLRTLTPEQRAQFRADTQRGDEALKEHGWAGELVVGAARLGRNILGAAAVGYNAFFGEANLSEAAKDMSLEERGAFYAAALSAAGETSHGAAQQFMAEHGAEFKETMQALAQSRYGLTEPQAAVFAESYDTDPAKMSAAVRNLKMDYAEKDASGNPMMDKTGNPILSEHNEQVADKLVDILQNSTDAGDRSGSYLTAVRGYNIARQGFEFPEAQSQQPQGFVQPPPQGHGLDFWTPSASAQPTRESMPPEVKPVQDEGEEDASRGPMPQPNNDGRS